MNAQPQTIKAIETAYRGFRFRSRLEARWAVFFDCLGIDWEYEPEGFEIRPEWDERQKAWKYLPDFRLTKLNTWVEVKGDIDIVEDSYFQMIAHAIDWGGQLPGVADSFETTRGLLWLGSIPEAKKAPAHTIIQHSKGGWCNFCRFTDEPSLIVDSSGATSFDSSWGRSAGSTIKEHLQFSSRFVYPGITCDPVVCAAYITARSVRFEHGEAL